MTASLKTLMTTKSKENKVPKMIGKHSRRAFVKDYEGYRSAAYRSNGALVVVYRAENEGGWVTLCDNHGLSANHRTRQLAENHAVFPEAWCDKCASTPKEHRMVAVTKEWEEGWLEARGVGLVQDADDNYCKGGKA